MTNAEVCLPDAYPFALDWTHFPALRMYEISELNFSGFRSASELLAFAIIAGTFSPPEGGLPFVQASRSTKAMIDRA